MTFYGRLFQVLDKKALWFKYAQKALVLKACSLDVLLGVGVGVVEPLGCGTWKEVLDPGGMPLKGIVGHGCPLFMSLPMCLEVSSFLQDVLL